MRGSIRRKRWWTWPYLSAFLAVTEAVGLEERQDRVARQIDAAMVIAGGADDEFGRKIGTVFEDLGRSRVVGEDVEDRSHLGAPRLEWAAVGANGDFQIHGQLFSFLGYGVRPAGNYSHRSSR
jgi:hypothetical protein